MKAKWLTWVQVSLLVLASTLVFIYKPKAQTQQPPKPIVIYVIDAESGEHVSFTCVPRNASVGTQPEYK